MLSKWSHDYNINYIFYKTHEIHNYVYQRGLWIYPKQNIHLIIFTFFAY